MSNNAEVESRPIEKSMMSNNHNADRIQSRSSYGETKNKDAGKSKVPTTANNSSKRMLRVEYKGNLYSWFDIEQSKAIEHKDFLHILRQNIVNYYNVPLESQILLDADENLLIECAEVKRILLNAKKPLIKLLDLREAKKDPEQMKDIETKLANIRSDVETMQVRLNVGKKPLLYVNANEMGQLQPPQGLQLGEGESAIRLDKNLGLGGDASSSVGKSNHAQRQKKPLEILKDKHEDDQIQDDTGEVAVSQPLEVAVSQPLFGGLSQGLLLKPNLPSTTSSTNSFLSISQKNWADRPAVKLLGNPTITPANFAGFGLQSGVVGGASGKTSSPNNQKDSKESDAKPSQKQSGFEADLAIDTSDLPPESVNILKRINELRQIESKISGFLLRKGGAHDRTKKGLKDIRNEIVRLENFFASLQNEGYGDEDSTTEIEGERRKVHDTVHATLETTSRLSKVISKLPDLQDADPLLDVIEECDIPPLPSEPDRKAHHNDHHKKNVMQKIIDEEKKDAKRRKRHNEDGNKMNISKGSLGSHGGRPGSKPHIYLGPKSMQKIPQDAEYRRRNEELVGNGSEPWLLEWWKSIDPNKPFLPMTVRHMMATQMILKHQNSQRAKSMGPAIGGLGPAVGGPQNMGMNVMGPRTIGVGGPQNMLFYPHSLGQLTGSNPSSGGNLNQTAGSTEMPSGQHGKLGQPNIPLPGRNRSHSSFSKSVPDTVFLGIKRPITQGVVAPSSIDPDSCKVESQKTDSLTGSWGYNSLIRGYQGEDRKPKRFYPADCSYNMESGCSAEDRSAKDECCTPDDKDSYDEKACYDEKVLSIQERVQEQVESVVDKTSEGSEQHGKTGNKSSKSSFPNEKGIGSKDRRRKAHSIGASNLMSRNLQKSAEREPKANRGKKKKNSRRYTEQPERQHTTYQNPTMQQVQRHLQAPGLPTTNLQGFRSIPFSTGIVSSGLQAPGLLGAMNLDPRSTNSVVSYSVQNRMGPIAGFCGSICTRPESVPPTTMSADSLLQHRNLSKQSEPGGSSQQNQQSNLPSHQQAAALPSQQPPYQYIGMQRPMGIQVPTLVPAKLLQTNQEYGASYHLADGVQGRLDGQSVQDLLTDGAHNNINFQDGSSASSSSQQSKNTVSTDVVTLNPERSTVNHIRERNNSFEKRSSSYERKLKIKKAKKQSPFGGRLQTPSDAKNGGAASAADEAQLNIELMKQRNRALRSPSARNRIGKDETVPAKQRPTSPAMLFYGDNSGHGRGNAADYAKSGSGGHTNSGRGGDVGHTHHGHAVHLTTSSGQHHANANNNSSGQHHANGQHNANANIKNANSATTSGGSDRDESNNVKNANGAPKYGVHKDVQPSDIHMPSFKNSAQPVAQPSDIHMPSFKNPNHPHHNHHHAHHHSGDQTEVQNSGEVQNDNSGTVNEALGAMSGGMNEDAVGAVTQGMNFLAQGIPSEPGQYRGAFQVVVLQKNNASEKFGLVNVPYEKDMLLIKFIDKFGLLYSYNKQMVNNIGPNPDLNDRIREQNRLAMSNPSAIISEVPVEVGDAIIQVNGVSKSVFGMRQELQRANRIELVIAKRQVLNDPRFEKWRSGEDTGDRRDSLIELFDEEYGRSFPNVDLNKLFNLDSKHIHENMTALSLNPNGRLIQTGLQPTNLVQGRQYYPSEGNLFNATNNYHLREADGGSNVGVANRSPSSGMNTSTSNPVLEHRLQILEDKLAFLSREVKAQSPPGSRKMSPLGSAPNPNGGIIQNVKRTPQFSARDINVSHGQGFLQGVQGRFDELTSQERTSQERSDFGNNDASPPTSKGRYASTSETRNKSRSKNSNARTNGERSNGTLSIDVRSAANSKDSNIRADDLRIDVLDNDVRSNANYELLPGQKVVRLPAVDLLSSEMPDLIDHHNLKFGKARSPLSPAPANLHDCRKSPLGRTEAFLLQSNPNSGLQNLGSQKTAQGPSELRDFLLGQGSVPNLLQGIAQAPAESPRAAKMAAIKPNLLKSTGRQPLLSNFLPPPESTSGITSVNTNQIAPNSHLIFGVAPPTLGGVDLSSHGLNKIDDETAKQFLDIQKQQLHIDSEKRKILEQTIRSGTPNQSSGMPGGNAQTPTGLTPTDTMEMTYSGADILNTSNKITPVRMAGVDKGLSTRRMQEIVEINRNLVPKIGEGLPSALTTLNTYRQQGLYGIASGVVGHEVSGLLEGVQSPSQAWLKTGDILHEPVKNAETVAANELQRKLLKEQSAYLADLKQRTDCLLESTPQNQMFSPKNTQTIGFKNTITTPGIFKLPEGLQKRNEKIEDILANKFQSSTERLNQIKRMVERPIKKSEVTNALINAEDRNALIEEAKKIMQAQQIIIEQLNLGADPNVLKETYKDLLPSGNRLPSANNFVGNNSLLGEQVGVNDSAVTPTTISPSKMIQPCPPPTAPENSVITMPKSLLHETPATKVALPQAIASLAFFPVVEGEVLQKAASAPKIVSNVSQSSHVPPATHHLKHQKKTGHTKVTESESKPHNTVEEVVGHPDGDSGDLGHGSNTNELDAAEGGFGDSAARESVDDHRGSVVDDHNDDHVSAVDPSKHKVTKLKGSKVKGTKVKAKSKHKVSGIDNESFGYGGSGLYVATDPSDPVDSLMESVCADLPIDLFGKTPLQRTKPNTYRLGDVLFFVSVINDELQVRRGQNFVPFTSFAEELAEMITDDEKDDETDGDQSGVSFPVGWSQVIHASSKQRAQQQEFESAISGGSGPRGSQNGSIAGHGTIDVTGSNPVHSINTGALYYPEPADSIVSKESGSVVSAGCSKTSVSNVKQPPVIVSNLKQPSVVVERPPQTAKRPLQELVVQQKVEKSKPRGEQQVKISLKQEQIRMEQMEKVKELREKGKGQEQARMEQMEKVKEMQMDKASQIERRVQEMGFSKNEIPRIKSPVRSMIKPDLNRSRSHDRSNSPIKSPSKSPGFSMGMKRSFGVSTRNSNVQQRSVSPSSPNPRSSTSPFRRVPTKSDRSNSEQSVTNRGMRRAWHAPQRDRQLESSYQENESLNTLDMPFSSWEEADFELPNPYADI